MQSDDKSDWPVVKVVRERIVSVTNSNTPVDSNNPRKGSYWDIYTEPDPFQKYRGALILTDAQFAAFGIDPTQAVGAYIEITYKQYKPGEGAMFGRVTNIIFAAE